MGDKILAALLCAVWARVYASRRSRPIAVPVRSRGTTYRG